MNDQREEDFTTLFESLSHDERKEFVKDALQDTISIDDDGEEHEGTDVENDDSQDDTSSGDAGDDIVSEVKEKLLDDLEGMIEEKLETLKSDDNQDDIKDGSDIDSVLDESLELENLKKRRELREQKLELIQDLRNGDI